MSAQLPQRIQQALDSIEKLNQCQIYFAPVRHHSPACAYALWQQIEAIKPTHILIEAPVSFNDLIPDLLNTETEPPLAILCQTQMQISVSDEEEDKPESISRSAFYPFCAYSPEWQALHQGQAQGAKLQFIDLPWVAQVAAEQNADQEYSRTLQAERYLAHSRYITRLTQKLHCRDHDDLWEHLFELRELSENAHWENFFKDVFIWCAMARLDYEPQVLEAEGSIIREQHMLYCIGQLKQQEPDAKIVVVTGGFHTLALVEGLWQKKLTSPDKKASAQFLKQQKAIEQDQAWLIRYSFDRLDALNGYASGMPSPHYYQQRWESMLAQHQAGQMQQTRHYREQMSLQFLSRIAQQLREEQFDQAPGFVALRSAIEQSFGLARLRGHLGPSRYDILDGLQTGFIKGSVDETQASLWAKINQCFSGFTLGKIPRSSASPPLVNEVYQKARQFRFKLEDTLHKVSQLDIYRKPTHRARSRFLHLLDFLQVGFARCLDGPDYIRGHRLDILFEDWQYAWTPVVEARLIELSDQGSQLEQLALKQLKKQEDALEAQGQGCSSAQAVRNLIQAALMGLHHRLPDMMARLALYIEQDSKLDSLVQCGHQLLHLWRGREFLGLQDIPALLVLLDKIQPQALFHLEQIQQEDEQQQQSNLNTLFSLRELIRLMPQTAEVNNYQADFYQQLTRLRENLTSVPLICGAVDAISFLDEQITETQLENRLKGVFSPGAQGAQAIAYFVGLMRTAPELIIQTPLLLHALDRLLLSWSQEQFMEILPDLRFAFSQLTPKQNAMLASRIAEKYHMTQQQISIQQFEFSEQDMLHALQLNHHLEQHLQRNHLNTWYLVEGTANE